MKNITYISASAGSGKTYELTERLKKAILDGDAKPEEVILTTFTKAAASEFKEKAKAKFYEAGKVKEADRLDQALIGTVDSVSNFFVNRYWYLLGISPNLSVIESEDESVYISESLSSLPTEKQNDFFHRFAEIFRIPIVKDNRKYGINYDFWKDDLKSIFNASRCYSIKDFSESINASKRLIESASSDGKKLDFDREELLSELDALDLISFSDKKSDANQKRITETEKFRKTVKKSSSTQVELGIGLYLMISNGKFTTKAYQASPEYLSLLEKSDAVWTSEDVRKLEFEYVENLFEIASRWREKYGAYKKEQHIMDYTDMEEYFLELLTDEKYASVQEDVKASYRYLFVDEFQDCSPTQIKIFDRLSELVERTVWVGDYKQAIYGFRGSDTALVKAVTDRIQKINGHPNETLGTSHRSWPDIVEVSNSVFVPAFSDMLRKEEVHLEPWDRLVEKYRKSGRKNLLKCWKVSAKSDRYVQIASNIAKMIDDGILPKDIAVLARSNSELSTLAQALKDFNIPVLVGDANFNTSLEIILLDALLSLVVNPSDTMARAVIAYLTENDYGTARILDRRLESISENKFDSEYLEEIPMIKKLMEKRNFYQLLNVSALVESLIIEMDLYNAVKEWPDCDNSVNNFHAAIACSQAYENHCIQMSLPCTIYGFIDYMENSKKSAPGISDGVQLFTYHGAKGLEWKNVILLSLEDEILDENTMISRNVYGVHVFHEDEPNADNPYPPMTVTVLPWIFGTKNNVPESVKEMILNGSHYERISRTVIQEEKRLMYVAMTRPVESLILTAQQDFGFERLKAMGVGAVDSIPDQEYADVLGIGKNFFIQEPSDMEAWKFKSPEKKILDIYAEKKELRKRDVQPSSCTLKNQLKAEIVFDSMKRIKLKAANEDMDRVGTCIHNVLCTIENNPDEEAIKSIIKNHGMEKSIPNPNEILDAWKNLESFLAERYGEKIASYHELPFKQLYDGQIFTGSIDFVWETKDGVVLVDFKSYPGSKDDVIDSSHVHFAGIYGGQFKCYERALKAAGKNVLDELIYYHVLGVAVKLN